MSGSLVHLTDGALPARLFARVRKAVEAVGEKRLRHTYQTTFWFGFDQPATNLVEEAIAVLRLEGKFRGAEWWLSRMRTSNVQVDFHRDRDERRALAGGKTVHPAVSSVLFLNRCEGGLLAVTEQPPNPANPALAPDRLELDLVEPRPNRYVWFDGRLTHGVLDAENQIPGRRLPRTKELRLTIAINFWNKRPSGIPSFSERRLYRELV